MVYLICNHKIDYNVDKNVKEENNFPINVLDLIFYLLDLYFNYKVNVNVLFVHSVNVKVV